MRLRGIRLEDCHDKSQASKPRNGFVGRDSRIRAAARQARWLYGAALERSLLNWSILIAQVNHRVSLILPSSGRIGFELGDCEKPSQAFVESTEEDNQSVLYEAPCTSPPPRVDGRLIDVGRSST